MPRETTKVTQSSILTLREDISNVLRLHARIASALEQGGFRSDGTTEQVHEFVLNLVRELERRRADRDGWFTEELEALARKHSLGTVISPEWLIEQIDRQLTSYAILRRIMFDNDKLSMVHTVEDAVRAHFDALAATEED